jgi:hypothetical protein
MGYYAESSESNFKIPADKLESALAALNEWRNLFPEDARWFYFSSADTLRELLEDVGFNTEMTDQGLDVYGFDGKWFDQNKILTVLKDFVDADSYVTFIGEDHSMWQWTPEGVKEARITWV